MRLNRMIRCLLAGACLLMPVESALAKPRKSPMNGPTLVAAHHGSYAPQKATKPKKKHFWNHW
jgi:hypothetical protein